jgi:hypothetical protein
VRLTVWSNKPLVPPRVQFFVANDAAAAADPSRRVLVDTAVNATVDAAASSTAGLGADLSALLGRTVSAQLQVTAPPATPDANASWAFLWTLRFREPGAVPLLAVQHSSVQDEPAVAAGTNPVNGLAFPSAADYAVNAFQYNVVQPDRGRTAKVTGGELTVQFGAQAAVALPHAATAAEAFSLLQPSFGPQLLQVRELIG